MLIFKFQNKFVYQNNKKMGFIIDGFSLPYKYSKFALLLFG